MNDMKSVCATCFSKHTFSSLPLASRSSAPYSPYSPPLSSLYCGDFCFFCGLRHCFCLSPVQFLIFFFFIWLFLFVLFWSLHKKSECLMNAGKGVTALNRRQSWISIQKTLTLYWGGKHGIKELKHLPCKKKWPPTAHSVIANHSNSFSV